MAKASEPSKGRRRDQTRRPVRRAADTAAQGRTPRVPRAVRTAPEDQRASEAAARGPEAQSAPAPGRPAGPKRRTNRTSGTAAPAPRAQSKPRTRAGQQADAPERRPEPKPERKDEPAGAAGDRNAAVAPPVSGADDRPVLATDSPAAASGPGVPVVPAAPILDEGATAREATSAGSAPVDAGAGAERRADRPAAATPGRIALDRAPTPDRAIQAFAAGSARLQEATLAFARAQAEDVARTGQALAGCTSVSAALALQVQAASRQFARCLAHGQTMASIGREMWQSLGRPNPGKDH